MNVSYMLWSLFEILLVLKVVGGEISQSCTSEKLGENIQESKEPIQSNATLEECETSVPYLNLADFDFEPRLVVVKDTRCLTYRMFSDMGFFTAFNISISTFSRFIQKVQQGYHDLPYHNWSHGFGVLHFVYTVFKNCKIIDKQHLTALEGLALMTAAMCHDIDHRGVNNNFHVRTNSTLAQRYEHSQSIMEKHHINVTLDILNSPETNFISNMDVKNASHLKMIVKHAILATDLSVQLGMVEEERRMVLEHFDKENPRHKQLLMAIIISCADLSDQTKSWALSQLSAKNLFAEFFSQGEKEKKFGLIPEEMMDCSQANIPNLEVNFLTNITIPNFRILQALYNETSICLTRLQQNVNKWSEYQTRTD